MAKKGVLRAAYTLVGDLLVNLEYYWRHIDTTPDANGCQNWHGPTHRQGYSMMGGIRTSDNKRIMTVTHRITAMLKFKRALTHDDFVIHTCSNVACQNPDHLILGDYRKKSEIMIRNGRAATQRNRYKGPDANIKQSNRNYRYTEAEIQWIRTASSRDIATKYNLTNQRASQFRWSMRRGYLWLPKPEGANY